MWNSAKNELEGKKLKLHNLIKQKKFCVNNQKTFLFIRRFSKLHIRAEDKIIEK